MADRMMLAALMTLTCTVAVTNTAFASCAIDNERLRNAGDDPTNWLMAGHDYSNQHFSALTAIDKNNIGREDRWEGQYRESTPDGLPLHRTIAAERAATEKYRDAWRVGGGSLWMRPAYEPSSGLLYAGTGNPSPQNYGASRPGDNLYTSGLAALALDDGRLDWFYQQVPHNIWGCEQAAPPFSSSATGAPSSRRPARTVGSMSTTRTAVS